MFWYVYTLKVKQKNLKSMDNICFSAQEFLSEIIRRKGDLSKISYQVQGDVRICGSFPYEILLGKGVFQGRFRLGCGASVFALDFQEAKFSSPPEILKLADIVTIYHDRGYFAEYSDERLHELGMHIPTDRLL